MSNSYVRPPHYQRHHQSMLLDLCSIHPFFETDNFDREYQKELASVISQYPLSGLDFCYYWTEKVLWDRFQLSSAYGEFPGKYGGPEYIVQQQVGKLPPTPESAEPAPAITAHFFDSILESLGTPSRSAKPVQPIKFQAPGMSKAAYETPVSKPVQQRVDLMAMPSQKLAQNHFEGYLKPQNPLASAPEQAHRDCPKDFVYPKSLYTPVQDSRGFANIPLNSEDLGTSLAPKEFSVSTAGPEPPTSASIFSSLLAARLASPGLSNPITTSNAVPAAPSSSLAPLPPLLLPDSVFKDPNTGELITIKMFERRCLGRGAEMAIRQAEAAVKSTPNRMTKPLARALLEDSLTTTKDVHLVKDREGELRKFELYQRRLTENAEKSSVRWRNIIARQAEREIDQFSEKYTSSHKSKDLEIPTTLEQIRNFGLESKTTQRAKRGLVSQPIQTSYLAAVYYLLQAPRVQTYDEMIAEEHAEMMRRVNAWRQEEEEAKSRDVPEYIKHQHSFQPKAQRLDVQ
ncbi:uncharacterized protein EAF01_005137 [Botrytis porri]|uniref:uncharacterized protein n=1 Tax=Botrytis porri TaxID=87229 RepID=UPI001902BD63|nr:uncharacterized protein EAF01_005137 [Botrytis porri]KAF7907551.1 hypothetical protein EAF01_005137 [Botrytis porri]